jgi:hypothetical protein
MPANSLYVMKYRDLASGSVKCLPGCFWRREWRLPPLQYSMTRQ